MNTDDTQLEPVVQAFEAALFYNVLKLMIDHSFALGKAETLKSLETICQTFMSSLNDAEKKAFHDELNETISQKSDNLHKDLSSKFSPEELTDVMDKIIKPALEKMIR
jgi:hypothetical protein